MTSLAQATISSRRLHRSKQDPNARPWTVVEIEDGYLIKFGDAVLETVNTRKPRIFKTLDSVGHVLRNEIGVTEFKVQRL